MLLIGREISTGIRKRLTDVTTLIYVVATDFGKMHSVGIKELKVRLSHFMGLLREGEHITVTDRGQPVAVITPVGRGEEMRKLLELSKEGFALWRGEKPSGSLHPVPIRGKAVSEIVLEGRR